MLCLLAGGTSGNPLASLFTRLAKDERRVEIPDSTGAREMVLGEERLVVHPSYAEFRASAD